MHIRTCQAEGCNSAHLTKNDDDDDDDIHNLAEDTYHQQKLSSISDRCQTQHM